MKITIELEEAEMKLLSNIINSSASQNQELRKIALVVNNAIKAEIIIDNKVTILLSQITGIPMQNIKNNDELGYHLGIGNSRKQFLAGPFQAIAREFKNTARITIQEVNTLETVQDCIDLIKNKTM